MPSTSSTPDAFADRAAGTLSRGIHARLAVVGRAEKPSFDLPFSHEVIGDTLGLSVPRLNRMLAQLRSETAAIRRP